MDPIFKSLLKMHVIWFGIAILACIASNGHGVWTLVGLAGGGVLANCQLYGVGR